MNRGKHHDRSHPWCLARRLVLEKLAPLLRAAGHEVYTPTLTGLGDRAHLLAPGVTLDTHVQDIVGMLECEDLRGAVMVGHSYGGMVMTAVADRAADRLAQLIYLDAFVPQHGPALADLADPAFYAKLEARARARAEGEGWRVPPPPLARWGITDDADTDWMRPRIGPHPLSTFKQGGAACRCGGHLAAAHVHLLHEQAGRRLARAAREATARGGGLALP